MENDLGSLPDWRSTVFWHSSSFKQARDAFWSTHMAMPLSSRMASVQQLRCACLPSDARANAMYTWACSRPYFLRTELHSCTWHQCGSLTLPVILIGRRQLMTLKKGGLLLQLG